MSGSFSKKKSNSQQTSESISRGGNVATSSGVSGGASSQSVAFEDLFSSLYGGASRAAGLVNTGGITDAANQLFTGGSRFLDTLSGNAGTGALEARLTDTSARDAQLSALSSGLGDFFNEQLIPGIQSAGVSTGMLGGAREGVATSLAAKQVAGQYAQGAAQILGTDQAQRDQVATSLAGLKQNGAAAGISSLSELLGIKSAGEQADLAPFTTLAQILGGPTVLGKSNQFSEQGSQSYGFDFSSSKSQGTSEGSEMGIGAGIDYGNAASGKS